ncbi:MAG: TIGR03960 family B12-binding radical SAM protein [Nitrospirota bacterium]
MFKDKILRILPLVTKPSRYIGAEVNAVVKDPDSVSLTWALCFPDAYEVGMSHLGLKVLYEVLNARPDIWAQRVFAPWTDMEEKLREHNLPLYALEGFTPLGEMDIIAFTLQYELSYTNILNMLDLAGLPVYAKDRNESHPLVIAGGPCALNPEPLADFVDVFDIGDSEEAVLEISDIVLDFKRRGVKDKKALLAALSKVEGIYVPAHFEVAKDESGRIKNICNVAGGPDRVRRRHLKDLDKAEFPVRPPVPYMAAVHNRVTLEISRGCPRGCRFCQAGYIYRPVRERGLPRLMELAESALSSTGCDELSLSSLSAGDYSSLLPLMKNLMDVYSQRKVSISLPSLRVGTLTPEMCNEIKRVRKTGFTIAPEAGTQRLRDVINKNISEDALVETAATVFSSGWDLIKLYFMVGLPLETDDDLRGIIDLSRKVLNAGKGGGSRRKGVNVGVSVFVPKAHTPFERLGQIPISEMRRRKDILKSALGRKPFAMKTGFAEISALESAFARGGRETGQALYNAWKAGARFDGWTENFNWQTWLDAFRDAGMDVEDEAAREFAPDEILPWGHIDCGVTDKFFKGELEKALRAETSRDCLDKCTACGLECAQPKGKPSALPDSASAASSPPLSASGTECEKQPMTKQPMAAPVGRPSARIRIIYTKLMPLAMLSHTEMMTLFFRAISRAGLPVAFSEGFNPHPKLSFGPALGVGIESEAEILDIELSYAIDLLLAIKALNMALPSGVRVSEARYLSPKEAPAGVGLTSYEYEMEVPGRLDPDDAISGFLAKESAVITRISDKGAGGAGGRGGDGGRVTREIDIRPMVRCLEAAQDGRTVIFTLTAVDGKGAKPFEAAQAIFSLSPPESKTVRIKRLRIF